VQRQRCWMQLASEAALPGSAQATAIVGARHINMRHPCLK
jgi:hypothetical protein